MNLRPFLLLRASAGLLLCSGCVCVTKIDPSASVAPKTPDPLIIPHRGAARKDWALVLSGGGIRSSLFGLGVMKTLYDQGVLNEVDVISTNSGGSYTAYLVYNSLFDGSTTRPGKFGDRVFKGANWTRTVARLQWQGNFVTFGAMAKALPRSPAYTHGMYERSIVRYGNHQPIRTGTEEGSPDAHKFLLGELRPVIDSARAPNLIITAHLWTTACKHHDSRNLEINPWYLGNRTLGYHAWDASETLPFPKAVAISGAALWPKQAQHIANPFTREDKDLTVADGGGVENLGAYSVLLRGFDNVVIVDGVQDARYKFEEYCNLKRMLDVHGIQLDIPELEVMREPRCDPKRWLLKNAVSKGTVKYPDGRKPANVYYIKMSRPEALFSRETNADGSTSLSIKGACKADWNEWQEKTRNDSEEIDPAKVERNLTYEIKPGAIAWEVQDYAGWLDTPHWSQLYKVPGKFIPFLDYYFPHMTTVDQSFYIDQVAALVGLGYLQAREFDFRGAPDEKR